MDKIAEGTTNCLVCGFNIDIEIAINNTLRPDCCDNCAIDRREEYLLKSLRKAEDRIKELEQEADFEGAIADDANADLNEVMEENRKLREDLYNLSKLAESRFHQLQSAQQEIERVKEILENGQRSHWQIFKIRQLLGVKAE